MKKFIMPRIEVSEFDIENIVAISSVELLDAMDDWTKDGTNRAAVQIDMAELLTIE